MNLISLLDLSPTDVRNIWSLAGKASTPIGGTAAWSFEGNGIRTRTTFIQAFRDLGIQYTELPNLLKTSERVCDLAGYLDSYYDLYVVRDSNHARLTDFAAASTRPVVNAMSGEGHPCEVLADAYYVHTTLAPLDRAKICLWGPPTNVLRSWHELARVMDFSVTHICDPRFRESKLNVEFSDELPASTDIVITDALPDGAHDPAWSLSTQHLVQMGNPKLLPTPPFSVGREIDFDPVGYSGFSGYEQKKHLLLVQRAILRYLLKV